MAQHHADQDNPGTSGTQSTFGEPRRSRRPRQAARAAHRANGLAGPSARSAGLVAWGLGLNAGVSSALFVLLANEPSLAAYAVGSLALVCLSLGVLAHAYSQRLPSRWAELASEPGAPLGASADSGGRGPLGAYALPAARWLLLGAYPASLGLSLTLGSERTRELAHGAFSMSLCAAALLAYVVAAVVACRAELRTIEIEAHPLTSPREPSPPDGVQLRRAVTALVLCGAFAIAVVAPLTPSYPELAAAWGDAADAGAALTALVGTAIAVSVVAVYLGAALRRAETRPDNARARRQRIVTLLVLTLLGLITYFTVIP